MKFPMNQPRQSARKSIVTAFTACLCLFAAARQAPAATFVVVNTNNAGPGSLRQAITDANYSPGTNTITFQIPGAGVHSIRPASEVPRINTPIVIDGYTQPGASPNTLQLGDNAVLLIEINGFPLSGASSPIGLHIFTGNSVVRGLIIRGFRGAEICLESFGTPGNSVVEGNFIGIESSGTTSQISNGAGVEILNSSTNRIGGSSPASRNVISGKDYNILIAANPNNPSTSAAGNTIQGNYIGTDASGLLAIRNLNLAGGIVLFDNAVGNVIGGTGSGEGNLISGNSGFGVYFGSVYCYYNLVQGNLIGTDRTGTTNLGNLGGGVFVEGYGHSIGGTNAGCENVIAYNGGPGVAVGWHANWPTAIHSSILANHLYLNSALGIDLNSDGVTPNDALAEVYKLSNRTSNRVGNVF